MNWVSKDKKYWGWIDKLNGKETLTLSLDSQIKLARENKELLRSQQNVH